MASWRTFIFCDVITYFDVNAYLLSSRRFSSRHDVLFGVMTYFLMSWRMFWHHDVLSILLMSWRTFWRFDILFGLMTYCLVSWHTCWRYGMLFDFIIYVWSHDALSILFYVIASFWHNDVLLSVLSLFCCFDIPFYLMKYVLTSWRTTYHTFLYPYILIDVMTYFLRLWRTFRTFWRHDLLIFH